MSPATFSAHSRVARCERHEVEHRRAIGVPRPWRGSRSSRPRDDLDDPVADALALTGEAAQLDREAEAARRRVGRAVRTTDRSERRTSSSPPLAGTRAPGVAVSGAVRMRPESRAVAAASPGSRRALAHRRDHRRGIDDVWVVRPRWTTGARLGSPRLLARRGREHRCAASPSLGEMTVLGTARLVAAMIAVGHSRGMSPAFGLGTATAASKSAIAATRDVVTPDLVIRYGRESRIERHRYTSKKTVSSSPW